MTSEADSDYEPEMDEPQVKKRRLSSDQEDEGQTTDPVSEEEEEGIRKPKKESSERSAKKDKRPISASGRKVAESEGELDEDERAEEAAEKEEDSESPSQEDTEEESVAASEPKSKTKPTKKVKKKKKKLKKKSIHRKDIRKIMTVDELDEETLAAQREEVERLQRIAEKQQNLRQSSASLMPVSFEDMVADNGMPMSLSDLYDDLEIPSVSLDEEQRRIPDKIEDMGTEKREKVEDAKFEPEVFTLSSDEDEPKTKDDKLNTTEEGPTKISTDFCNSSGGVVYSGNSAGHIITLSDEEQSKPEVVIKDGIDEDDDDCIVISPTASDQEEDKDEDANNRPDEFGQVLVNIGHPESEPDIYLPSRIAVAMKPHQIGGVRFLYDNLVETLDRFDNSSGFGCILAHSMGLGKTIQAAAFCEIFIRCTSARTVLVIVPINTIQNWSHEFNYWLPTEVNSSTLNNKRKISQKKAIPDPIDPTMNIKEDSADTGSPGSDQNGQPEENKTKKLNLFVLNETIKTLEAREKIISEWGREGGVLLIGYEMYRMLSLRKLKKSTKTKKLFTDTQDLINEQDFLLDKIHKSLVRPGPDLVICDEGHRIKNSGASISQALKAIRTRRRVVLTGYPLQNNLMEYWCMVDFIRPNYLGTKAEFSNMFERPISNGQCADSTPQDKRLMQFRSHVLHTLLQGFVQRKSHAVLKRALPPKQEHVFLVKMSPIQFRLYKEYINYIQNQVNMGESTPNPIKAFAVCSKLWNHPDVLYRVMKKKQSVLLDDLELEDLQDEVKKLKKITTKSSVALPASEYQDNSSPSNDSLLNGRECIFTGAIGGVGESPRKDNRQTQDRLISLEWANPCFEGYTPGVLENGTKFQLLFIIIEETLAVGDKLLVFSQSLLTLDLMETFLHAKYEWRKGQHYFRLDGSTQGLEREKLINEFNGQHSASVFLVSTKAGSLGVNLVGANRVVVFDASWNPCHDCQAVCRIYRYGQKKPCQIYRFVTDYTLEKQIYDRQIHKGGMANRVVDEMNPDSHFNSRELISTLMLEIRDLEASQDTIVEHDVDNFSDSGIRSVLLKCGDQVTKKPFEHESLLIDRKEKKLSAAERRLALRNYEMEKNAAANSTNGSGRGPTHTSGGGIVYSGRSGETAWNSSSSSYSSSYEYGRAGFSKPVASIRPYQRGMYEHGSVSMVPNTKPVGSNMNWPAVIEDLRRRGVLTTQVIKLRKNYVMPNPTGGSDIYLRPGDRLELIRARKCSYIRLMSGQFMAMRRGSRGFTYLDTIPFSQQLSGEQLGIFLSSFLREVPPDYAAEHLYQSPLTYTAPDSSSSSAASSSSRFNSMSNTSRFNYGAPDPPSSFPLPPSVPYGSFSSNQNTQPINQYLNNSGSSSSGVKIWLKEHIRNSARQQQHASRTLVPEMELIKINPSDPSRNARPFTHNESTYFNGNSSSRFPASTSNLADQISISTKNSSLISSAKSQLMNISRSFPFLGQSSRSLPLPQTESIDLSRISTEAHHSSSRNYHRNFDPSPSYLAEQQQQSSSSAIGRLLDRNTPIVPEVVYENDRNESEVEILKVGTSTSAGISNGGTHAHEETFQWPEFRQEYNRFPSSNNQNQNQRQPQYYPEEPIVTNNNSDNLQLPLPLYSQDADRFKYS